MKTAREWFQCLRPDLRDRAIKNTFPKRDLYVKYHIFSRALDGSFVWSESHEGFEFWIEIRNEALDIEQGRKPDIK